jgi:hypothetical protein
VSSAAAVLPAAVRSAARRASCALVGGPRSGVGVHEERLGQPVGWDRAAVRQQDRRPGEPHDAGERRDVEQHTTSGRLTQQDACHSGRDGRRVRDVRRHVPLAEQGRVGQERAVVLDVLGRCRHRAGVLRLVADALHVSERLEAEATGLHPSGGEGGDVASGSSQLSIVTESDEHVARTVLSEQTGSELGAGHRLVEQVDDLGQLSVRGRHSGPHLPGRPLRAHTAQADEIAAGVDGQRLQAVRQPADRRDVQPARSAQRGDLGGHLLHPAKRAPGRLGHGALGLDGASDHRRPPQQPDRRAGQAGPGAIDRCER